MAQFDPRNCRKSPSQGGYTREELNEYAKGLGIDPTQFGRKDDLCDEILRVTLAATPTATTTTPGRTLSNTEIADQLTRLSKYYMKKGEQYRAGAFQQAAAIIAGFTEPITDVAQLRGIRGIGGGVIDRVNELLLTGRLAELAEEEKLTNREQIAAELATVFGIGPATATKMIDQGVTGINDLIERVNAGQIHITEHQRLGLQYYNDFKQRIPRSEIDVVGNYILRLIDLLHQDNVGTVVGSYRRGRETSGDIDILMSNKQDINTLAQVIQHLVDIGLIKHIISQGNVKFMGTYRQGYPNDTGFMRKIDIRFVPYDSWIPALLHSTGSDSTNVKLRKRALELNMSLSEFGLFKIDPISREPIERIPIQSEEDVFKILGLPYLTPEQRN